MKQQKIFQTLRIVLFAVVMIGGCVLGFILPLRPEMSESEMRYLAEFPEWNAEEFMDGTYTANINLWYSDTFPFRDDLLELNNKFRNLWGIKTQAASSDGKGDDIETGGDFTWNTEPSSPPETTPDGETKPGETTSGETAPETQSPATGEYEVIAGYFVEGKVGYQLYYFSQNNAHRYARAVVKAAKDLDGRAQVYCMITPMPYDFHIPDKTLNDLGVSDCKEAIDWYYYAMEQYGASAGLQNPVITLDAYSALEAHKDEYIFFRTDHHWTPLGAYYASRTFLDAAGRTYPTLKDGYTPCDIPDFTGTLANKTQSETPVLINNPDTIHAYIPKSVNTVTITTRENETLIRDIVNPDPSAFSRTSRYRCFIDGDYPYSVVHNENITDGSAILVIKDSYGNAFTPMLVDSYEYVYVADHRWFRAMSLSDMVETYGIDTVLFLNNPASIAADWNTGCVEALVNVPSKIKVD